MAVNDSTQPKRPDQPSSRGGCGCWLGALVTAFVVTVLVIIGLFLPPVNLYDRLFGEQFAVLNANEAAVIDGVSLSVSQDSPFNDFGVHLSSVTLTDFEMGNAAAASWIPDVRGALPPYLALQSPIYSVQTTGTPPDTVTLAVDLPAGFSDTDVLDLYGYYEKTGRWRFIPSDQAGNTLTATVGDMPSEIGIFQATPLDPIVMATVNLAEVLSPDVANLATIVAPAGLTPALDGTLTGSLAPGFDLNAGYRVMPVIRNFSDPRALDPDTVTAILSNSTLRSEHARQIAAVARGYDGVFIDYRGIPADQRDNFSAFMTELGADMREANSLLGVVIPAAEAQAGVWETGAYDWRVIGQNANYVQIDLGLNPTTFQPGADRLVEAMLRWGVRQINRYEILLGLSALSVREAGGDFTSIGYNAALAGLGDVKIDAQTSETGSVEPGTVITAHLDGMKAISGVDTLTDTPYVEYQSDSGDTTARMWLTTGDALRFRMDRTVEFALAGTAFEDLLSNDIASDVLPAIQAYKTQIPAAPGTADLALQWRIEDANGLVDQVTTGLNEDLVVTLDAPGKNYAINVAVVGVPAESQRSGAAVAVFLPTSTPTPLPTSTPTPMPTVTPSPAPVVATPVPSSQEGPPVGPQGVVRPGPGSIQVGNFEYGGQVHDPGSGRTVNAMHSAGMTWMKVQIRYSPGASPSIAGEAISAAHNQGFKILLGLIGWPNDLAAGGSGYVSDFANFVGGVASMGPDAIEVWNEQNLDREWPTNQISAQAYTDLLRQAYTRAKAANGSVMIISGAPAPTGAEAAYPGQVVNDDRFLREMVAAGALNYADCVGMHYNEGIVDPSATSGDPRDNYYTRYFWGMVNTYWNITGGSRPLCFTELGYLTGEGYGALPDFFAWAQNVTISQQAAWLAQAAALSSTSGKVALMIVWNVDFTAYGADPQAGYAIIRADGSCPACTALAGAR